MKLAVKKTDDGVQYGGEKLTYHAGMDSEFENIRLQYIKKIKKNIGNRFRMISVDFLTVTFAMISVDFLSHLLFRIHLKKNVKVPLNLFQQCIAMKNSDHC